MGMGEGVRTRSPRRLTRSVNSPKPWDVSAAYDHPNTKIDELLPWTWTRAGSQAIVA